MAPREKVPWTKKHSLRSEILPPINATQAQANCPMKCDKTIRIPRKAYDLAHAMRASAIEKAANGEDVGITFRVDVGRMVLKALQEFALAHHLLPTDHPLLSKPISGGVR